MRFRFWISAGLGLLLAALPDRSHGAGLPVAPFRVAFTSSMFTDVNELDARAAMKIWILTVAKERGLPVDPNPHVCPPNGNLARFCRTNQVDGMALLAPEYWRLSQELKCDRLAVSVVGGSITEEYVLVVHQDSPWERVEQLQGRTLHVLNNPRMSLAEIWLDTVLLEAGQKRTAEFFGSVTTINKATRVVLPVFFRQADACLTTRKSFALMGELNPQLNQQLRILAGSSEVVPSAFAFRSDYVSPLRMIMLDEMTRLSESPAGQQILSLTQSDRFVARPVSCLDSALELLEQHHRLCGGTNVAAANSGGAPDADKGGAK